MALELRSGRGGGEEGKGGNSTLGSENRMCKGPVAGGGHEADEGLKSFVEVGAQKLARKWVKHEAPDLIQ